MRIILNRWAGLLLAALVLALAGCASGGKMDKLQELQYAYSAAIRWGDFEGAWNVVDPEYREAHPMSPVEFERYKHIQISAYRELSAQALPDDTAARVIEIGVINKHTMAERTMRYNEQWRYDPETKNWWISDGLPDFWAGE